MHRDARSQLSSKDIKACTQLINDITKPMSSNDFSAFFSNETLSNMNIEYANVIISNFDNAASIDEIFDIVCENEIAYVGRLQLLREGFYKEYNCGRGFVFSRKNANSLIAGRIVSRLMLELGLASARYINVDEQMESTCESSVQSKLLKSYVPAFSHCYKIARSYTMLVQQNNNFRLPSYLSNITLRLPYLNEFVVKDDNLCDFLDFLYGIF